MTQPMPATITQTPEAPSQTAISQTAPVPPSRAKSMGEIAPVSEPLAPEVKPAEAPKSEPQVSKAFIEIKRRKREIAEKERIIQRREQDLAAKQREYAELKELQSKDPWEFAHKMGFNARDVAKRAVEQSKESPEAQALKQLVERNDKLEAELKELREGFENRNQESSKQQDIRAVQEAFTHYESEMPYLADESIEDITAAFDQVYRRDYEPLGAPLTPDDVKTIFEFMESNLRETYEGKISRIAQKRGVQQAPSKSGNGAVSEPAKPEARSPQLTNLEASQVASSSQPKLSSKDRLARAIAKLKITETE